MKVGVRMGGGLVANLAALDAINKKAGQRAIRLGVNDWSKVALGVAKANLKAMGAVDTKALLKALGRRVKAYRSGATVYAVIGARMDQKGKPPKYRRKVGTRRKKDGSVVDRYANPIKYVHLVELGTRHSRPRPFMRAAYYQTRPLARRMIAMRVQVALMAFRRH